MDVKVYTDGSFYAVDGIAHGGLVLWNFGSIAKSSVHVVTTLEQFCSMRNVGGEILAAWYALKLLITGMKQSENFKETEHNIELIYDYEGVGKWVSGEWAAKKPATRWYRDWVHRFEAMYPNVHLKFTWTKGHAGDDGNEIADAVANYDTSYCRAHEIPIVDVTPLLMKEARW